MKKIAKLSLCALAGAALASCCTDKAASPGYVSREALASGFVTPPDSIQTSVYWYWISNNISKEGVVKDLESMKRPVSTGRSSATSVRTTYLTATSRCSVTNGGTFSTPH